MAISRNFLLIGSLYLLLGVGIGSYMGASGKHDLAPLHAHINLLGFTLMTLFGLAYRLVPNLAGGWQATAHFWLHQIGALVLLISLFLLMTGRVAEAVIGPVFPLAEALIFLGILAFLTRLYKNA